MTVPMAASPKKIAMYYPCFSGGGAEAVALWMLEALKDRYDLTIVTLVNLNWAKLNAMYGTHLDDRSVKIKAVFPPQWTGLIHFLYTNNKDFRAFFLHWTLRSFKQKAQNYDLVISGYNAADLGQPGLQYIHWIKVLEGETNLRRYYHQIISQFSLAILRTNLRKCRQEVKESYPSL